MQTQRRQIEGNLTLRDSLALYGQVTRDIVVAAGGDLHLYGICARNLTVQEGGKAVIRGMVCGQALNDGGDLQVLGTIVGSLRTSSGNTEVNSSASVLGGCI